MRVDVLPLIGAIINGVGGKWLQKRSGYVATVAVGGSMVLGFKVLIDFAHNPAAMSALFDMASAIPAQRRALCFGQAGDRTDELIRELARDAWAIGLERVVVSELPKYHRGREHGDVFRLIRDELLSLGAADEQVRHHEEELESLQDAIDWAQPGDLVIMLALGGAAPVQEKLRELEELSKAQRQFVSDVSHELRTPMTTIRMAAAAARKICRPTSAS